MNASRIIAIMFAIGCVGLGAASLNLVQQNRELNSQLATVDSARQANSFGEWDPDRAERRGGLRQALEAELAANAELRQELARLKGELVTDPPPPPPAPAEATNSRQSRGGGSDSWMERIRQQDPERYKQIIAERDQRYRDAQDRYENTLDHLHARSQAPATPDEATLVNQISDTLSKLNDLRSQMSAARQLPEDERQAQMGQLVPEMRATWQQLTTLRDQDRQLQYVQLGKQLGLPEDKAQALATSIPTINQNTQYAPRGGGGPGGGGGFGGGQSTAGVPGR